MTIHLAAGDDWAITITLIYAVVCLIVVAALAIAIFDFRRMLKRHHQKSGFCRVCGYDLRATKHERCPECGDHQSAAETNALTSETSRTSRAS